MPNNWCGKFYFILHFDSNDRYTETSEDNNILVESVAIACEQGSNFLKFRTLMPYISCKVVMPVVAVNTIVL